MKCSRTALQAGLAALALSGLWMHGGDVLVPNHSFEAPPVILVGTGIDSWEKAPKPAWYDESGGFLWDQLTGVFKNTTNTSPDHIDNIDGHQAIWLFAVPEVGLFQDFDSLDWRQTEPTHDFDAEFERGTAYQLTVGAIGGGGGMLEGARLEIGLYYRDTSSNAVTVASTNIAHSVDLFPTTTHFVDVRVDVPTVQASDPWAGKKIGIRMTSTVSQELAGGYWDLDNVRLLSVREPALVNPAITEGGFQFSLESEPGAMLEILTSDELNLPTASWNSVGIVTNASGSAPFIDNVVEENQRFYRARQVPRP